MESFEEKDRLNQENECSHTSAEDGCLWRFLRFAEPLSTWIEVFVC